MPFVWKPAVFVISSLFSKGVNLLILQQSSNLSRRRFGSIPRTVQIGRTISNKNDALRARSIALISNPSAIELRAKQHDSEPDENCCVVTLSHQSRESFLGCGRLGLGLKLSPVSLHQIAWAKTEQYRQPNFSRSQIWDSDRGAVEELGQGLPGFYDFISKVEAKNVG